MDRSGRNRHAIHFDARSRNSCARPRRHPECIRFETEATMLHQFDTDDVTLLDEVLEHELKTLLLEIAKADDRSFRDELRHRHARLEAIRKRLTGPPVIPMIREEIIDIEVDYSFR